jgi:hypothetical protein
MKSFLMWIAVFAFATCAYAQETQSLGDAVRQNPERKKASRTFTNDDVNGGTIESVATPQPASTASADAQTKDDDKAAPASTQTTDGAAADQPKPDRSNFVGDVPGETAEPKDRIETLKQHASQWDHMIANFETKIAAETNPEKRDSLETMLEHARQNQAKDAAEQKSLETSEAEKASAQPDGRAGQEQPPAAQPQ